jgi:hypothetical protein
MKTKLAKKGQEIVDVPKGQVEVCCKEEALEKPPVSEAQRKAMWVAASGKSELGIPKSVGKDYADKDPGGKLPEKVAMSDRGQWSIKKAEPIKPPTPTKGVQESRTLDYGKINPMDNPLSNPKAVKEAKAKHYADVDAKAGVLDYQNMKAPPKYTGAAERTQAVRDKIGAEGKETAAETIARRQKMKKDEGILVDKEPSVADKSKMTAKNETMGYGAVNQPAPMTMSEKEPEKESRSVFSMSHANEVLSMKHEDAKKHLHSIVDGSTANAGNKAKIKAAINGSKNVKALSGLVANHILAAGGGGTKTGELKVIR